MTRRVPRGRVLPVRRRRERRAPRERAHIADWVQAIAGVLTVAVAVPAVTVALDSYREQQEINRSQLDLALLERSRYEQRYASRVAIWRDAPVRTTEGRNVRMKMQNRAPVPITLDRFVVARSAVGKPDLPRYSEWVYAASVDVPPCTALTFELRDSTDGDAQRIAALADVADVELIFMDVESSWRIGRWGLTKNGPKRSFSVNIDLNPPVAVEVPGSRAPAEDCGEGS